MKLEEKRPMSFRTLLMVISACIFLLAAVLIVLSYTPEAFAGDATSFNPTSVSVQAKGVSDTPIGGVIPFRGTTVPDGWLECNGQSTAGYPELAAAVGPNVPDLRGEFIRGWDNGRGLDSGRALGSSQSDAMEAHSHTTTISVSISGSVSVPIEQNNLYQGFGFERGHGPGGYYSSSFSGSGSGTGVSTTAGTGNENRPRNIALMYIIKAQ